MADPSELRTKAAECRQLATHADAGTTANLLMLADDYEAEADRLEAEGRTE